METECYEWVFLIALVTKDYSTINEILNRCRSNNASLLSNIHKGLTELLTWSQNE